MQPILPSWGFPRSPDELPLSLTGQDHLCHEPILLLHQESLERGVLEPEKSYLDGIDNQDPSVRFSAITELPFSCSSKARHVWITHCLRSGVKVEGAGDGSSEALILPRNLRQGHAGFAGCPKPKDGCPNE